MLRKSLDALMSRRKASGTDLVPAKLGEEEPEQAYSPEQLLGELNAGTATFVRGRKGQTCLQACSAIM